MALTKLPKNAFATGSVDDSKIEDGTIQNVELSGSLANDRLVNSTITFNGTSTALGGSVSVTPFVEWQSVITADGSTATSAVAGEGYFIDTTSNTHTVTLPASPSIGDKIAIKDYAGTFATNNLTIGRNGNNIQGVANDSQISTNRASLILVYSDATRGWLYTVESNVTSFAPTFTSATGGTVTESGDFKIHTFTGDGCFVVSSLGNVSCVPTGGPSSVDYLVVAGGGGGGNFGGGGAGGYRTSFGCCSVSTLPVTTTSYPITVGGGGSAGTGAANTAGDNGNTSSFSTITSTGGGGGGAFGPVSTGKNGGSGGGGGTPTTNPYPGQPGGTGNTPPVSPPQGNPGGNGGDGGTGGGGGGGAACAGTNHTPPFIGGDGGAGAPNSITGSSVFYAGGGGGGGGACAGQSAGSGGVGGGGDAGDSAPGSTGTPGTANTGGGGGGAYDRDGGTGGKGIVIIRYKFQ